MINSVNTLLDCFLCCPPVEYWAQRWLDAKGLISPLCMLQLSWHCCLSLRPLDYWSPEKYPSALCKIKKKFWAAFTLSFFNMWKRLSPFLSVMFFCIDVNSFTKTINYPLLFYDGQERIRPWYRNKSLERRVFRVWDFHTVLWSPRFPGKYLEPSQKGGNKWGGGAPGSPS